MYRELCCGLGRMYSPGLCREPCEPCLANVLAGLYGLYDLCRRGLGPMYSTSCAAGCGDNAQHTCDMQSAPGDARGISSWLLGLGVA